MPRDDADDFADEEFDDREPAADEAEPPEPGDQTFWQAYNRNLEFPTATLMSVFAHVLVVAGLVGLLLLVAATHKDKKPVPITLVDNGNDDFGAGNPNEGGEKDAPINGDNVPTPADFNQLPSLDKLPEVKEQIRQSFDDPMLADSIPIPDDKAAPLASLDQEIRDKIGNVGKKRGAGGEGAAGPGGNGADSTRARSLRWVMRFKISSGREYLNQLQGLGAVVVMPVPPSNKSAYVYKDLSGNGRGELMNDDEWKLQAQKVQFCDYKVDVVKAVAQELHAPVVPHAFWAFFPKKLEDKLAAMERAHQNKPSEDIEETVFEVVLNNGTYDLQVVRQTLKK